MKSDEIITLILDKWKKTMESFNEILTPEGEDALSKARSIVDFPDISDLLRNANDIFKEEKNSTIIKKNIVPITMRVSSSDADEFRKITANTTAEVGLKYIIDCTRKYERAKKLFSALKVWETYFSKRNLFEKNDKARYEYLGITENEYEFVTESALKIGKNILNPYIDGKIDKFDKDKLQEKFDDVKKLLDLIIKIQSNLDGTEKWASEFEKTNILNLTNGMLEEIQQSTQKLMEYNLKKIHQAKIVCRLYLNQLGTSLITSFNTEKIIEAINVLKNIDYSELEPMEI